MASQLPKHYVFVNAYLPLPLESELFQEKNSTLLIVVIQHLTLCLAHDSICWIHVEWILDTISISCVGEQSLLEDN